MFLYSALPRRNPPHPVPLLRKEKRLSHLQILYLVRVRDKASGAPYCAHVGGAGLVDLGGVFEGFSGAHDGGEFFGIVCRVGAVDDEGVEVGDDLVDEVIGVFLTA